MTMSSMNEEYTVAWICALPEGLDVVRALLDKVHPPHHQPREDRNAYLLGTIGPHNVVVTCLPVGQGGIASTATVAESLARTFPAARLSLLVGIGGGVPDPRDKRKDIRLGDVVVSVPGDEFGAVVQYDFGKYLVDNDSSRFVHRGQLDSPPTKLLSHVNMLNSLIRGRWSRGAGVKENELQRELESLGEQYAYPSNFPDRLFCSQYPRTHDYLSCGCDTGEYKRPERASFLPVIHEGTIASGDAKMADGTTRDRVNQEYRNAIFCFDTEAAGLMNSLPCLVVRGISNYADAHGNDGWRLRAIATASSYAKALILQIPAESQTELSRNRFLQWLSPIDHAKQQRDYIEMHHRGTGAWLLQSLEFTCWCENGEQILFCPGIPGAGKSVLFSTIVRHLQREFIEQDHAVGLAYFYLSHQSDQLRSARELLASLLMQLLLTNPGSIHRCEALQRQHRERQYPSLDDILDALNEVIPGHSRVFFLIDALDQYHDSHRENCLDLLHAIIEINQQHENLSILVTSRPRQSIEDHLGFNCLKLEISASDTDIRKYLGDKLAVRPRCLRGNVLQEEVINRIAAIANGMFLLAKLYIQPLHAALSPNAIREILKQLPAGYDQTYTAAMERIKAQSSWPTARQVLAWIVYSKRPLTPLEVQYALAEPYFESDSLPDIADLIDTCHGLVAIYREDENEVVGFVHASAREYLDTRRDLFDYAHEMIAITCMNYLSTATEPSVLYDYASSHWGEHAQLAMRTDGTGDLAVVMNDFLTSSVRSIPDHLL
ncbi:hypothetical protein ASPZODRAFT_144407 [Penicilliopsis zonata CBS 506.65]|uniref:NACHT domain-containing protein n=1 Tax=Penicilliopsis zonata CBS 506.65 TaxID=1073090 RepID=A0A1L9SD95_9EURO|nr:hypothetical protein ASPZODRAFT_144407 [Penicilliopsis zonata CBS 506.65]OJJ45102.1 hypothetical protein ASPZODRAFT_144407 [Penicilliopsis zonata CBS 506.65]